MKKPTFPPGWNAERVKRVLAHYENQTEEEAVAEDEAAMNSTHSTVMEIPPELLSHVRALLASHEK